MFSCVLFVSFSIWKSFTNSMKKRIVVKRNRSVLMALLLWLIQCDVVIILYCSSPENVYSVFLLFSIYSLLSYCAYIVEINQIIVISYIYLICANCFLIDFSEYTNNMNVWILNYNNVVASFLVLSCGLMLGIKSLWCCPSTGNHAPIAKP